MAEPQGKPDMINQANGAPVGVDALVRRVAFAMFEYSGSPQYSKTFLLEAWEKPHPNREYWEELAKVAIREVSGFLHC